MKHLFIIFSIMGIFLSTVQMATAQNTISWEIRTGVDFATQEIGDAELNTGFGFDGLLAYWLIPNTSIFGGWGWHRFTSGDSFAGSNMDFEETGFTFGLEYVHPWGSSLHGFYLRGGGVYSHINLKSSSGNIMADTGYGLGWQAEAGLAFLLGNQWVLRLGVRYESLSEDIRINDTKTNIDLTYYNAAIGISRPF